MNKICCKLSLAIVLRIVCQGMDLHEQLKPLKQSHTRLYLVRHGETDWNSRGMLQGGGYDIPLNRRGKDQARAAMTALSSFPIDLIASSHLSRASETADTIHEAHQTAHRLIVPELSEMRFGELEGMAIDGPESDPACVKKFHDVNALMNVDADVRWPGLAGESPNEVGLRTHAAITKLLSEHPKSKHIVIVAHGRANKIILAKILQGSTVSHSSFVQQGNACLNVLDLDPSGSWEGVILNYEGHLKKL